MNKAWMLAFALTLAANAQCDPIDFNKDGLFPDTQDIDDFRAVFAGGESSTGEHNDIDFNNDGIFPDTADLDDLLRVFAGGPCVLEESGWTALPVLPAGARVVYVASAGSDSNDGLTPATPKRRWPTAFSLVRSGLGDRVCVVGDLTLDEVNGASMYSKSDVTVYGETPDGSRPIVRRVGAGAAFYIGGDRADALAFLHLDLRGEDGAGAGFQSYVTGSGWLIEGCSITGFASGMNIDGNVSGLTVRRTTIADNQTTTAHSQGVFLNNVTDGLFDECVIDRNGRGYPGGAGTMYNHNGYITASCNRIELRNSITSRASATGWQARWNTQNIVGSLVIDCPLGITLGHDVKLPAYPAEFVTGGVIGNFIVGTADIAPDVPRRGPGVGFGLARNVTISGNYLIDAPNAAYGAIRSDRPSTHVRVIGNYSDWPTPVMQWGGTASSAEPTNMVDVDQGPRAVPRIEDYLRHYKVVPATKARFIELARQNRKGSWDARWTAQGYIQWAKVQ